MEKNKDHFIQILEAHQGILFKVCNFYCQEKEERQDLMQDILVQVWSSLGNFDESVKLSTWVYRIALNVAISNYRKRKVRGPVESISGTSILEIPDHEESPNEKEEMLKVFINELDELNKALMLMYLDGNSHEEIAMALKLSKSNVGTKINRIKSQLKVKFQHHD